MDRTIDAGTRITIVPSTDPIPRNGEGSAVLLRDGRILFIYSRFTGGGRDHDTADLYGGILDPQTGAISDRRVFLESPNALNQMSVSLERLNDGSIGMCYIRKTGKDTDDIWFSRSEDEGQTWSTPVCVDEGHNLPYIVVNNDRLRQAASGRLLIPGSLHIVGGLHKQTTLGVFYSDDNGQTWQLSEQVVEDKGDIIPPHRLAPGAEDAWQESIDAPNKLQEPGIEELPDGRFMLYCRISLGYMYRAFSDDGGITWGPLKAAPDLVSALSPQSIRRIPGTDRLLCVYNDHRHIDFGAKGDMPWYWRTPLSLALSDDSGNTWRTIGHIEDDSHNYCYTSILFLEDQVLLTYYESENTTQDGQEQRRNLAHLKMQVLPLDLVR